MTLPAKSSSRVAVITTLLFLWALLLPLLAAAAVPDPDPVFKQANELMGQGDLPGALAELRKIAKPGAGEDGEAYARSRMQMGRLHFSLGELTQAEGAAREVLA